MADEHVGTLARIEASLSQIAGWGGRLESVERQVMEISTVLHGNGREGLVTDMATVKAEFRLVSKVVYGGIALALTTLAVEILHLVMRH